VFLEFGAQSVAVGLVSLGHFKVIAPAREFDAVIAEGFGFLEHGIDGQIGPLTGEKCDCSWHGLFRCYVVLFGEKMIPSPGFRPFHRLRRAQI
jgi:hypothetical protein